MRFVIVGAGAIGGTMGAHLARAGHDVLFVDSVPEHVAAMTRDGLEIEGRLQVRVKVPAVTPDALAGALAGRAPEAVLLAVKALHTAEALEPVVPLLGPESYVVSMQNGLNERVIAARIGAARTIGAFVNFGADYQAPGRVEYSGAGALYLGELDGRMTPRLQALGDALRSAFLPNTTRTDNILGYLWGKHGYASQLFATATVDATMADVLGVPDNLPLMANLAAGGGAGRGGRGACGARDLTGTIPRRCDSRPRVFGGESAAAWRRSSRTTARRSSRKAASGATSRCGTAAPRWICSWGRSWRSDACTGSDSR